eukprot:m.340047 g.340047  ORF g.340047 m.340047 type:complete len:71 (+) comp19823_c3_seq12:944-1156(+)
MLNVDAAWWLSHLSNHNASCAQSLWHGDVTALFCFVFCCCFFFSYFVAVCLFVLVYFFGGRQVLSSLSEK